MNDEKFIERYRDQGLRAPAPQMGEDLLRQLEADCTYINQCIIPMVREKGITTCNTRMLLNYAQNPHLLKWGAQGRVIERADLLLFTGKKMVINKEKFRDYFEGTPQGKELRRFKEGLTPEARNLMVLTR